MSATTALLLVVMAQVGLTLGLLWLLGTKRVPEVNSGRVRMADIALDTSAYPEAARKVSNSFDNQFQLPVILYVFAGMSLFLQPGWADVVLALAFVASRFVHAAIHVTSNHVRRRFLVYTTGYGILLIWFFWLAIRILGGF